MSEAVDLAYSTVPVLKRSRKIIPESDDDEMSDAVDLAYSTVPVSVVDGIPFLSVQYRDSSAVSFPPVLGVSTSVTYVPPKMGASSSRSLGILTSFMRLIN